MIPPGVLLQRPMPRSAPLALGACLLLSVPAGGRQPAPESGIDERAVVVARDLFAGGRIGDPDEISILVDGRSAPVIGVAEGDDDPLHTLIVLDATLGDTTDLRRAAIVVAGLAGELTALGPVRVVVVRAEEIEERVSWSGDGERIEESLSRLGVEGISEEVLSTLRLPWTAADVLDGEPPVVADAERAAREAARAIVGFLDRLLELAAEPQRSSRRLLLVAGGGFDPCPGAFFGVDEVAPALTGCDQRQEGAARTPGLELGPTLAILGWTVAAIAPLDPQDPKAWRFGMLDRVDEEAPQVFGVVIKINQERKPARARLYLEQARVHLAAGQLDAAEEDGRKAIHHFQEGRKTRAEQGEAWRLLAGIHARRGEPSATARSLLRAHQAEPDAASAQRSAARLASAYRAARRPLEHIAEATGGAAVYDADDLSRAISEIASRRRVTYQLPEAVAIEPLRLEARTDGRLLETSSWTSPTPTRLLSLAGARRLLRTRDARRVGQRPGFGVFTSETVEETGGRLDLFLELSTASPEERRWSAGPWRVTVLRSELDAEQHHVEPTDREPASERFSLEVDLARREPFELILVEDLATGAWGFQHR
ncbi:MAG TPA: hypothetical protein VMT85_08950 [Thermoanaerobaculia bacterium]|nr:hypothetical protein [Thermoanaerobaculia bacterium]